MRVLEDLPHKVKVLEEGVWIPLSSGHRLAARIILPDDAEQAPVPALLEYLPYRKRDLTRAGDVPLHGYLAGHGYASVRVDLRGAGDSFGVMRDEYTQQEHDDAIEVIAWLAAQPWCSGKVGMFGISWGGFNSLQVAARRPPALKAIVTSCSTDDRYRDDMHYMGGCLLNDNLDWGTTFFSILPLPGDPAIMGEAWRDNWMERLADVPCPVETWLEHQHRDAYWKHGSVNENYDDIEIPVFAVGGWLDGYSNAIFRLLANLKGPRLGLVGAHAHQWGHAAREPGPAIGFLQESLRWWDYWLKDEETGIMDEPMLRVLMQEDLPARPWYQTCPGRWVGETSWPSPRTMNSSLHLNAGGLSGTAEPETVLANASPQVCGLSGGEWCPYGTGGDERADGSPVHLRRRHAISPFVEFKVNSVGENHLDTVSGGGEETSPLRQGVVAHVGEIAQNLDGVQVGIADRFVESDHVAEDKLPAGAQDATELAQRPLRPGPVMRAVTRNDEIECVVVKGQRLHVAQPRADIRQPALIGQQLHLPQH